MRPLNAHDIIRVWELGLDQHPVDRALTLLRLASPETPPEDLARLPIGARDALLLTAREQTLGSRLQAFASCPQCGERLEFSFWLDDIRVTAPEDGEHGWQSPEGNLSVRFRLPTSLDLAAIASYPDESLAYNRLLQRCLLDMERDGAAITYHDLDEDEITQIVARMAECDPQAEVLLSLDCPACQHRWRLLFDIVTFFWTELAVQAKRLLREVHALARAYGWREADILAMSARRRQMYLEMVGVEWTF